MGSFTGIGKLPSELTEKTSLSETDIVITGSAAQRTTWKNVLEKISFSGLATTAKNIIGAINELNTKNSKDLRSAPTSLYSGEFYNSELNTYKYLTINNLSTYQEVGVRFRIGDSLVEEVRINANTSAQNTYSAYFSNTYNGKIAIHVDFANNRIGIKTVTKAGWEYRFLSITNVYGYLRK